MKLYVFVLVFGLSTMCLAEEYSCEVTYTEVAKIYPGGPVPQPVKTFVKKTDFSGFRKACEKERCQKFAEIVTTDSDLVFLIAHNAKPPVLAAMLMHLKYDPKLKDFVQQSFAGTDFGNRFYLGSRSGEFDIMVECRYSSTNTTP